MKLKELQDEKLIFDDGTTVQAYHDQDCCESVYADFAQLKDTDFKDKEFKKIKIEQVPNSGFRLNGYFIPCYNIQNGYYSSNLKLIIINPKGEKNIIDISDCVEDDID